MSKSGIAMVWTGVLLAVIMGLIASLDLDSVCQLDAENLPETLWTYPALCFVFWAFSVPIGVIIAATGKLVLQDLAECSVCFTDTP